jgi:hypothetical protein
MINDNSFAAVRLAIGSVAVRFFCFDYATEATNCERFDVFPAEIRRWLETDPSEEDLICI